MDASTVTEPADSQTNPDPFSDGVSSRLLHYNPVMTTGAVVSPTLWAELRSRLEDVSLWMQLGGRRHIWCLSKDESLSVFELRRASAALLADLQQRFSLTLSWIGEESRDAICCTPEPRGDVGNNFSWLFG